MIEAAELKADIYPAGPRGLSAYEIYKKEGGQLSEEEWLKSLNGLTPTIGENGNWFLGTVDTGLPSRGPKGDTGSIKFIVVTELPTENIDETAIYLKPVESPKGENNFEELIYVNGKWEDLGTPNVAVDLSNYYTKEESDEKLLTKQDKLVAGNGIELDGNVIKAVPDFSMYSVYYAKPKDGEDYILINDLPAHKYPSDAVQTKKVNVLPTGLDLKIRKADGSIVNITGLGDINSNSRKTGFRAVIIQYSGNSLEEMTSDYAIISMLVYNYDSPQFYLGYLYKNNTSIYSPGSDFPNGDIVTDGQVSFKYAKKNSVLTKTNTTSYTPTSDYHPATKKYVDDQVGNINTVLATLTTVSEVSK